MLRARALTAIVLLPLTLALLYLGGLVWASAMLVVGLLGWHEMSRLLQRDHFAVKRLLGFCFVIAAIAEAYLRAAGLVQVDLLRPLLTGLILASLIWALYDRSERPTANWAMNTAGALYMGFLLGHFVTLRLRPDGLHWTLLALLLTWTGDMLAYFFGSALGRHKLWPRLSPKKSWEGFIAGTVGALVAGGLLGPALVGIAPWLGVLLGLLVALGGVFGDLAISLMKRMAHAKDSSNIFPGHGGMLDRMDSLMFTLPITTYFALIVTAM